MSTKLLIAASGTNKQGYGWIRPVGLPAAHLRDAMSLNCGDFIDWPAGTPLPHPGATVTGEIQYAAKRRSNPNYVADDPTSEQYLPVPGEARMKFIPEGYKPQSGPAQHTTAEVAPEEDGF